VSEYRVDDLAHAAGTTVGNVRVYQDRGLLPPPLRKGRVAIYTEAHLARLRIVVDMLARGYAFAQIKEMFTAWESGRDLADVLGLKQVLTEPWSNEAPAMVPATDLLREFGRHATPDNIKRALRLGILERRGMHVVVLSPRLLQAGRELIAAGVPVPAVLDLAERLQRSLDGVAELFLSTVSRYVLDPKGTDWVPSNDEIPEITELAGRLWPLAQSAVSATLAQAMSKEVARVLDERFGTLPHRS
jgi:DNA-binding transcriptional MerR regulator